MAANPAGAGAAKALAAKAQASLKSGDVKGAADTIKQLQAALDQAPDPAKLAALEKARATWTATRKKVESELDKLHKEMTAVYKDHGFGPKLDKVFHAKVEPMLSNLDESLSQKLDEVTKNTDPGAHTKLVGEAKQIVQKYEKYVAGEKLIAKLDANPFVPLQIEKTLHASLEALAKVIT
jgi:predicted  nucleic acid-binding Zn-ribbon protein